MTVVENGGSGIHCQRDLKKCRATLAIEVLNLSAGLPLRQLLVDTLLAWFPNEQGIFGELKKVLQSGLPLGALVDILTFALPLTPDVKQQQLEQVEVAQRVESLVNHLTPKTAPAAGPRKFPPEFSSN